jgi:predicted CopG family antitoxin
MNVYMQKTISLPEDVYSKLKRLKRENETFADLISRLIQTPSPETSSNPLEKFFGAFEDQDDAWGKIEERLYALRLKPRDTGEAQKSKQNAMG